VSRAASLGRDNMLGMVWELGLKGLEGLTSLLKDLMLEKL
jgi:hypothetical protein